MFFHRNSLKKQIFLNIPFKETVFSGNGYPSKESILASEDRSKKTDGKAIAKLKVTYGRSRGETTIFKGRNSEISLRNDFGTVLACFSYEGGIIFFS
jgi:hypothetical protein